MKQNKALLNTSANLISRVWTMIANYLFVPIYISLLGEEAYGLVTFFATLQTTLNLLGLGLSKTLRREFASTGKSGNDSLYKYQILRSVEFVYFLIAIIIVLICSLGAEYISNQYLVVETIPIATVMITIKLMGVSIAAQLLANLYLGCLFGKEQQVLANAIQIAWSIIKNVGVIFVVKYLSQSVSIFYVWHVIIDVIYLVILRETVVVGLRKEATALSWNFKHLNNLKTIWRFALGIMVISIGYAVNTQADKMIISGSFSLPIVGAYNSTYTLGLVASVFVAALGIAVFPRFTRFYTDGRIEDQKREFVKVNRVSNIVTASIGIFVASFSKELLLLWTGSQSIADVMEIAAFPLIIGTTMNALQEIPYNYFLSSGVTIVNNIQTVCSILYVIFVTPVLIANYGIVGAASSWLIQMTIFTFIYLLVFYKMFFKGEVLHRMLVDTGIPIISTFVMSQMARFTTNHFNLGTITTLIVAIAFGIITVVSLLLIYCRRELHEFVSRKGR